MAIAKKTTSVEIDIPLLQMNEITLRIIGTRPLFQNRMTAKAMQTLLIGGGKKTAAEKKEIKHNPLEEYRNSLEQAPNGPTALRVRMDAVKGAMCEAALKTAGINKTDAQKLLFAPLDYAPLFGTPQLRMDVTRSADMNRTPDVRTRGYLPKWGAEVTFQFVSPELSLRSVTTLLSNAGQIIGIGDFRQGKGKGSYGAFRVISADQQDDVWDELVKEHGRMPQLAAINDPEFANDETAELMHHFYGEVQKRRAASAGVAVRGGAWRATGRTGSVWQAGQGAAWSVLVWRGWVRRGTAGAERLGGAMTGMARPGKDTARQAWRGVDRQGKARIGRARYGRPGSVRLETDRQGEPK